MTTIQSKYNQWLAVERTHVTGEHTVSIRFQYEGASGGYVQRSFRPDEFLAAVATELDVLVIPRTDLPKVDPEVNGRGADVGGDYIEAADADDARTVGLRYLALAEYLDAHPPIDQAQVDTLATLLRDTGARPNGADTTPIARRLIATGRITVTPAGGAS